jgi:xanthosine utilization system XapX-like protein
LHVALNKKRVLESELWVTSPRPPLLNSAGILGMVVRSTAYKDKLLIMRIIAAQPGTKASGP